MTQTALKQSSMNNNKRAAMAQKMKVVTSHIQNKKLYTKKKSEQRSYGE